jgi:putative spermidine/putrescine transport system ATP-binding protein
MAILSLENVTVAYNKTENILQDFNLSVNEGELVSLLGPSGCGKTTTLRLVAGFLNAKSGVFRFQGKDYNPYPVHKRNFGFVFQNYALFPHLNVFDNVAFGLKQRKVEKNEIRKRVLEMLKVVNMEAYEKRYISELSGGQRQRVAIARALVINPDLLLFDEPLSNLDANLRVSMRVEIRRIQQELGITSLYVSHDQEECFSISDKVAIMNKGIIEQLDEPATIYKYPATDFVAKFIGFENFITFDVQGVNGKEVSLATKGVHFTALNHTGMSLEQEVVGAIRPEHIEIVVGTRDQTQNSVAGEIKISTFLGGKHQYVIDTEIGSFTVIDDTEPPYQNGTKVKLHFPQERIVLVKPSQ